MSKKIHCNVPNAKIPSAEWKCIEECMYPGKCSGSGFLDCKETLKNVIDKDNLTLQRLGITCEQIADRLTSIESQYHSLNNLIYEESKNTISDENKESKYLHRRCSEKNEWILKIESNLLVSCVGYMGAQVCPFRNQALGGNSGNYGSIDFTVKNTDLNESFSFNTLLPHMIKTHQFFEGSVSHRVDPETVIRVLNIKPGVAYAPKYKYMSEWFRDSSQNTLEWDDIDTEKAFEAIKYYSVDHKKFTYDTKQKYSFSINVFLTSDKKTVWREDEIVTCLSAYEKKASYKEFKKIFYENENVTHRIDNKRLKMAKGNPFYSEIRSEKEIDKKCEKDNQRYLKQKKSLNLDELYLHMIIKKIKNPDGHMITSKIRDHIFELYGLKATISEFEGNYANYEYLIFYMRTHSYVDV